MKVVIDLQWLEKQIDQQEQMASNEHDADRRDVYYAMSHLLQRVRSAASPIEPIIDATWHAAQQATADMEGYINLNMDVSVPQRDSFKKQNGYGRG
jgi:isoleucyl-tRNA synthetase